MRNGHILFLEAMKQVSILILTLTDKAQLVGLALGKKEFRHVTFALWEFILSQNPRMAEVERDLRSLSCPSPRSRRATKHSWLPRISVQMASEYLQDGESTICLGNLWQCSAALKSKKKVSLMIRQSLLCCSWCPLPPVLSLGTSERSLALFSF